MGAAIEIKGLVKRYGELTAVDGISLTVEEGQIFGILGPNGAGKTTTLEIVEGIRKADAGEVKILGLDHLTKAKEIKQLIGVQLQATATPERLTVRETIELFGKFFRRALPADHIIKFVQLEQKESSLVRDLSGGQAQRLAIGLALVNDPKILFLDEPTTGLDPAARRSLWDVVDGLQESGKTVVLTTHYMEEAERLCDLIAIMDHGKIVAQDTPDGLIKSFGESEAIEFNSTSAIPEGEIAALPGATKVQTSNGTYAVFTSDATSTIRGLVGRSGSQGWQVEDIRIRRATLEDVFVGLTGRRLRE